MYKVYMNCCIHFIVSEEKEDHLLQHSTTEVVLRRLKHNALKHFWTVLSVRYGTFQFFLNTKSLTSFTAQGSVNIRE